MTCIDCKKKFTKGITYKGISICFKCDSERWEDIKQEEEFKEERRSEYLELIKEGIENNSYE